MNDYIIEKLLILSCNIDDFNPQNYEYISQKLFEHNGFRCLADSYLYEKIPLS